MHFGITWKGPKGKTYFCSKHQEGESKVDLDGFQSHNMATNPLHFQSVPSFGKPHIECRILMLFFRLLSMKLKFQMSSSSPFICKRYTLGEIRAEFEVIDFFGITTYVVATYDPPPEMCNIIFSLRLLCRFMFHFLHISLRLFFFNSNRLFQSLKTVRPISFPSTISTSRQRTQLKYSLPVAAAFACDPTFGTNWTGCVKNFPIVPLSS